MTARADKITVSTRQHQAQRGRLLDRIDAAIAAMGRAIWRAAVEGFAAYGMAECAMLVDPRLDHVAGNNHEWPSVRAIPLPLAFDNDDLQGDFDDIRDLIRSLEMMDR